MAETERRTAGTELGTWLVSELRGLASWWKNCLLFSKRKKEKAERKKQRKIIEYEYNISQQIAQVLITTAKVLAGLR